jgi:hypothetical protein
MSEMSVLEQTVIDCGFSSAIMDINHRVGYFRFRNESWRARYTHYVQASVEICRVIEHVTYNYIVIS